MILDLRHVRIRTKLLGLVLLPVVGGGLLSGLYVAEQARLTDRLQRLRSATSLSVSVGDLVHALQAEVSATVSHLGPRALLSSGDLAKVQEGTDRQWAAFEAATAEADPALRPGLPSPSGERQRLLDLRRRASRSGGSQELLDGYAREIQALLHVQSHLMLPAAGTSLEARFQTYGTLLHTEDQAGLEGALVAGALAQSALDPGFRERLLGLVEAERVQGEAFLASAPEPLRAEFQKVLASPDIEVIQRIRDQVLAGNLEQDGDLWSRSIAARQADLKRVQDSMSFGLLTDASALEFRARTRGWMLVFAFGLFGLTVLLWTWHATALITRPLLALAEGMARMKEGDLRVQLPLLSYDETGRMTESFNGMSSHLRGLAAALQVHAHSVSSGSKALSTGAEQISTATLQLAKSSRIQRQTSEDVINAVTQLQASIVQVRVNLDQVVGRGQGATDLVREAARRANELRRVLAEAAQAPQTPDPALLPRVAAQLEPIFEALLRVETTLAGMEGLAGDIHLVAEKQSTTSSEVSRRMQASESATGEVQLATAQLANTAPELVITARELVSVARSLSASAEAFKVE